MSKVAVGLYLPEDLVAEAKGMARERGRSLSVIVQDLLNRAIAVHRGVREAQRGRRLGPLWPSGVPKLMPCPEVWHCVQAASGRPHTSDPAVGHGWPADRVAEYVAAWEQAGGLQTVMALPTKVGHEPEFAPAGGAEIQAAERLRDPES